MKKVFFLTNDENKRKIINSIVKEHNLIYIDKINFQQEILRENPSTIIIDLDSFERPILQVFQSVIDVIGYIPTIGIYNIEENVEKIEELKNAMKLSLEQAYNLLPFLIEQSKIFNKYYGKLSENYNAIDYLNSDIKNTTNKYLNMYSEVNSEFFLEITDSIFFNIDILHNIPEKICLFNSKQGRRKLTMISLESGKSKHIMDEFLLEKEKYGFNVNLETGFYRNNFTNEISDIEIKGDYLPKIILDNCSSIKNFAGFLIDDTVLIGLNYKYNVTNYEVEFLKALAVKIDLINNIKLKMDDVEDAFVYTMNALARAAEGKDDVTGHHIKRVSLFSKIIAENMVMREEFIKKLYNSAQMHDVGKINIDENILNKPGKLTQEEFEEIKKHTIYGENIIGKSKHLKLAAEIARHHHEKYDGTGYPDGLKGEEIPISARIVFLADIYDALRSSRPYKEGFSHEKAFDIIIKGDGRVKPAHFDPQILEIFKNNHLKFKEIYDDIIMTSEETF